MTASNCNATQQITGCNSGTDIYYQVYVSQRSVLYADTFGSPYDNVINISSTGTTSLACNDDSCGTAASQIALVVNPGWYYIAVGGYGGQCGSNTLHVQAVPASNSVTTVGRPASNALLDVSTVGQANMVNIGCGGSAGDITRYWLLCPGVGGGTFSANTCSSITNYDSVLAYRDGTTSATGCNDDGCGFRSTMSSGVTAGPGIRAFYIDGWSSSTGRAYTRYTIP